MQGFPSQRWKISEIDVKIQQLCGFIQLFESIDFDNNKSIFKSLLLIDI